MGHFYCIRADITDLLEPLTGSEIATTAQQDAKLLEPASRWIDSVYPSLAPFPAVPPNDPQGWLVATADHEGGASTVTISGGTGDPGAGDIMRPALAGMWSEDLQDMHPPETLSRAYRVVSFTAGTGLLTYEPAALDDFPYRAPIYFGTPSLIRQACRLYGCGLALTILRRNPLDDLAAAMFTQARELLGVRPGGRLAAARPETGTRIDTATVRVIA
jgi:hypothetical protein